MSIKLIKRIIVQTATQVAEYYPFGSTYAPLSPAGTNKYLYNGKEKQDDVLSSTALDEYDYGARFYDPQIGRWHTLDPLAEMDYSGSTYSYVSNAPINLIDPDGRAGSDFNDDNETKKSIISSSYLPNVISSTHTDEDGNVLAVYNDGDLGIYVHPNGTESSDVDKKHSKSNTSAGGAKKGETYYWDEFKKGDRILFDQSWNSDLIELAVDGCSEGRLALALNSRTNHKFDIKSIKGRISKTLGGKYISSECAGNFLAGFNAGGRYGLSFIKYMQLAGALHQTQSFIGPLLNYVTGITYGSFPWYGEIHYAGRMIVWGWIVKSPQDKEAIEASDYYNSSVKK